MGASHNWKRAELMYMLRVVIGSGNIPASELPRKDLALWNDSGRVALQAILPKCDAKGILDRASGRAPGLVWILEDVDYGARRYRGAAQAPGAGAAGGTVDPQDSRRVGMRPRSPSALKSHQPWPPPLPPQVAVPQRMAHDAKASGLTGHATMGLPKA
ncbi:hypothetical protein E2562_007019 [Oryza meyeriana var. granulata]|uniref:Uncharacterized protein n=1 Tax=Oryza meyeriana var. granulata TaxID=110450 RepID=A0A6G1E9Y5_9ORYZ|nr:hypothetical protein E2562_007019 [Oryza meyeriana var. granulata]